MPDLSRFHSCRIRLHQLLLLSVLLSCLALSPIAAQTSAPRQQTNDTPLTPQQQVELDDLNKRATQAYAAGDLTTAAQLWDTALTAARATHNGASIGRFLNNLGVLSARMGQLDKALDYHRQALDIRKKVGSLPDVANSLNNMAKVYYALNQFDKALETMQQVVDLRKKIGKPEDVVDGLNNLGEVYRQLGQMNQSVDCYQQVVEIRKTLRKPKDIADSLSNLSATCYIAGQFDRGVEYAGQALEIYKHLANPQDIVSCLTALGMMCENRGQLNRAVDCYEQALDLNRKLRNSEAVASNLNNLGDAYFHLAQYNKSQNDYQQALDLYTTLNNLPEVANDLNNLGNVYQSLTQPDRARDYYQRALELRKKLGDSIGIATCLNNLGTIYDSQGQFDKALDNYKQALEIRMRLDNTRDVIASLDNSRGIASVLDNLGNVYFSVGQLDKSMDYHRQALELRKQLGNPLLIATSLAGFGNVYDSLEQYDKALDYYQEALKLIKSIGNHQEIARNLGNLASVYNSLGQYDRSLEYDQQALELNRELGNPQYIAANFADMGLVYDRLGQYDKALQYDRQALDLNQKLDNPQEIAAGLTRLGLVYVSLGQYDQAIGCHQQALALRTRIGNTRDIFDSLLNLCIANVRLGRNDKLRELAQNAVDQLKTMKQAKIVLGPQTTGATLDIIAYLCVYAGELDTARDLYQQALEIKKRLGNSQEIASSLNNIGTVYYRLHQLSQAEAAFSESRKLKEGLTEQIRDPSQVGALQESFGNFYERYARLLVELGRPQEALEILEAGRGQGLRRLLLTNLAGGLHHYLTAEEQVRFQQVTVALNYAGNLRQQALLRQERGTSATPETAEQQVKECEARYREAQQSYDLVYEQMFRAHPKLNQLVGNIPVRTADLLRLAHQHPDTLYLEYGVVDDATTLLFALGDRDGFKSLTLPTGTAALTELSRRWRQSLERAGGRGVKNVNPSEQQKAQADEATLARQAYLTLLGPVEKAGLLAPGRYHRLVIVGSGPLLDMPTAALCDPDGRRLIERYPLSHTLALSVFFWPGNSVSPRDSMLCIADPTGEKDVPAGPQVRSAGTSAQTGTRGGVILARMGADTADRPRDLLRAGFAPLSGARAEGKAVAHLFKGANLLIGPEAREETILKLLPKYALLHFATHAFLVPDAARDSGLVLAEEPEGSRVDGLLTASKIMNVPLAARLAVLSACETGRGRAEGGEGLMGLAWAFRAAGCPSLVASQWAINDAATQAWMLTFYGELKAGKPKDEALQTAMLAVKKAHSSPYYWAAFELIGETNPLSK